jgi:hypothetical protein
MPMIRRIVFKLAVRERLLTPDPAAGERDDSLKWAVITLGIII